jgi:hypothetical protein
MRRGIAALPLFLLLVGASCESSPKGDKLPVNNEVPEPAQPPIVETAKADTALVDGLIDVESEPLRVARLVTNEALSEMHPSEYCLDDGKLWKGARYRLGRVNVFGIDDELAALDTHGLVAIVGDTQTGLDSKLQLVGPCPKNYQPAHAQMRSDWIAPEGGPITTHERLKSLSYQEGRKALAVDMVEILASDEAQVRLRIRNPFSLALAGLRFDAHYEGGGGKPMPTLVEQVLALQPGASTEIELPRQLEGQAPNTKAGSGLHSLKLQGRLGKADLDIEIFVVHN